MRVFVNGCFDVLHIGHIRLLKHAFTFGELTVGINSDSSIRAQKGSQRPINNQDIRREFLLAINGVKRVIVFDEYTPFTLLHYLYSVDRGPHVVVKGSQYENRAMPEQGLVEQNGGRFEFFPTVPNYSTTGILERLV